MPNLPDISLPPTDVTPYALRVTAPQPRCLRLVLAPAGHAALDDDGTGLGIVVDPTPDPASARRRGARRPRRPPRRGPAADGGPGSVHPDVDRRRERRHRAAHRGPAAPGRRAADRAVRRRRPERDDAQPGARPGRGHPRLRRAVQPPGQERPEAAAAQRGRLRHRHGDGLQAGSRCGTRRAATPASSTPAPSSPPTSGTPARPCCRSAWTTRSSTSTSSPAPTPRPGSPHTPP